MKYESYSVQQLFKRKGKPWRARLKYKDPLTGKWKDTTKMLGECSGKREAKKLAEAWFNEMNEAAENAPNLDREKTVGEMVLNFIGFQLKTGRLEQSSYNRQQANYKNYVKPFIADYFFISFDRTAITVWLSKLHSKGLGEGTISNAFYLVKKVYDYHYEIGELNRNPFTGVKAPRAPKPKVSHLTKKQTDDYLEAVYANYNPEDKFYAAALLLLYSGLRRGEVCGLRWRDVDLKQNILSVETAIGVGEKTYTKQPKTPTSKRSFPMIPQLKKVLKQRYEAINPEPNWFVCGDRDKYWNPQSFSNTFRDFVKSNELKDVYDNYITPHKLRHNLGYVGINSSMDIASLSKMFGHASRAMTLDTYGDSSVDAMNIAATKLSEKFDNDTEFFKLEPEVEE